MKAIVIPQYGGPEVLTVRDMPSPESASGEVLVRTQAVGVNFADIMSAAGGYPGTPPPPLIAGREYCGELDGSKARVMGYTQWGAFAETVAGRQNYLWPVPAHWTSQEGAAFPVNYFTAYLAYWKAGLAGNPSSDRPSLDHPSVDRSSGSPRSRVLIHAAAGGVGTAAVQIGKLLGIETYGTSSSAEKLTRVKELGLDHGINYRERDYEEAIREMTSGEGVDAVFEMLGGEHTLKSVKCLREFGSVIVYGAATGKPGTLDPRALYAKGTSVHGLWLSVLAGNKKVIEPAWAHLSQWIAADQLRPIVGHVFPMEQVRDAFQLLLNRQNFGKVVLTIP